MVNCVATTARTLRSVLTSWRKKRVVRLGFVCLSVVVSSCSGPTFSGKPNVILISLDTLRNDAVGPSNGRESLTPHLDSFAESSIVYTAAFTSVPFTPSAHMTMITGYHHAVHGVAEIGTSLPSSIPTLAELLAERGYHTFGRYTTEWLDPEFGFARGFDSYVKVEHAPTYAWRVNDSAVAAIEEARRAGGPFFAFLHYYDVHSDFVNQSRTSWPYFAPPEYRAQVQTSEDEFCVGEHECATRFLVVCNRDHRQVAQSTTEDLRRLYESGVRYTDEAVGELLAFMRDSGLLETSVVVVTSDHGEEFREHGMFLHSQVYEETIAVPLILHLPLGLGGGRTVEQPVDLREVFSVIELMTRGDLEITASTPEKLPLSEQTLLFQDKVKSETWGLLRDGWKIIVDRSRGEAALFRRDSDALDATNLAPDHPEVVRELRELLEKRVAEYSHLRQSVEAGGEATGVPTLSEEAKSRLEALGYLQ